MAQAATRLAWDSHAFMGIDEIKPGMVGYGKTVYQGTKIETFNIVVIGVLRKIDVDFDMILIKVTSGPCVEQKLYSVEGMSGSPIYIHGRLIGAYAFGWREEKEAVAGVTPIAEMLDSIQPGSAGKHIYGTLHAANLPLRIGKTRISRVLVAASAQEAKRLEAEHDAATMVLRPVATPVTVSGIPNSLLPLLRGDLADTGLDLASGMGGGYVDTLPPPPASLTLEPGSALAVPLCEGDVNAAAIGTVTYVKGNTVLAFGHPFDLAGETNMPMYVGYITHIMNTGISAFKLGMAYKRVGTLTEDRQHAVAGELGKDPQTIPFSVTYGDATRGPRRKLSFRLVNQQMLTPIYASRIGIVLPAVYASSDTLFEFGTFTAACSIVTDTQGTLRLEDSTMNATILLNALPNMLAFCQHNPYSPVNVKRVDVSISYSPQPQTASIERVVPDRQVAHPGETVNLEVSYRPFGKPVETKTVAVTVPPYCSESMMLVAVTGTGRDVKFLNKYLFPPAYPEEGAGGVLRWLSEYVPGNNLVVAQLFPSPTLAVRGQLVPNIPTPAAKPVARRRSALLPRATEHLDGRYRSYSARRGHHPAAHHPVAANPDAL